MKSIINEFIEKLVNAIRFPHITMRTVVRALGCLFTWAAAILEVDSAQTKITPLRTEYVYNSIISSSVFSLATGVFAFWVFFNITFVIFGEFLAHDTRVDTSWYYAIKKLGRFCDDVISIYFLVYSILLLNGVLCGKTVYMSLALVFSLIYFIVGLFRFLSAMINRWRSEYEQFTKWSTGYVDADGFEIYPGDKYSYQGMIGWIVEGEPGHYFFLARGSHIIDPEYALPLIASELKVPKQKDDIKNKFQ